MSGTLLEGPTGFSVPCVHVTVLVLKAAAQQSSAGRSHQLHGKWKGLIRRRLIKKTLKI